MAININLPKKHEQYNNRTSFPQRGNSSILYVAKNNMKLYTWSGSAYVDVSPDLASSWGSISEAPKPIDATYLIVE